MGLLLIHGQHHHQGFGSEAVVAIEEALAREGWLEFRLGVMRSAPGSRGFWEHLGYFLLEERLVQDKWTCWVMRKPLVLPASTQANG